MAAADAVVAWRGRAAWLAALLGGLLLVLAFATPRPAAAASYWVPSPTETWQWNLAKPVEPTVDTEIYDIDAFENEASVVAALHALGRHVVCYMDAGSWENWRPDAGEFPASVLGNTYAGFSTERWLDIRQLSILEPIMTKRLEMCKAKGFDGVEADNVEGWENSTGFPITTEDQLVYNKWLASEAHALGLSIALKNDVEQTKELVPYFDWDLTEECAGRKLEGGLNECSYLKPFTEAHKAVWSVEYNAFKLEPSQFCPEANKEGFMAVKKNVELDAWQAPCWPQGDWVGKKGAEGYDLAAFNGSSDLINMPGVTVTLVKGSRVTWASSTTDPRALESPSGSSRTAAGYSDPTEVSVQLHFEHAYKGNLHLYVVDWESQTRRETITAGTQTATLAGTPTQTLAENEKANHGFNQGSWVSFPINVAAGTTLPIDVKRNAGTSAVLSAIMLGDAKPSTPPPTVSTAPEGSWLATGYQYGSSGYLLADWDGVQDVSDLPDVTATLTKGSRYGWAAYTADVRALEGPEGTTRNAATYYDPGEIKLQLGFSTAYSGNLHLYAVDWDSTERRESITVNDGSGPRTVALSSEFHNGAWVSVPINVAAGGTVSITVTHEAGANAVLSGIFLGEAGAPPGPTVTSAPQGAWTGAVGSEGYDLAGWDGTAGDVSYLPKASLSLIQGSRWEWAQGTSDARALSDPSGLTHNAGTYYDPNQIQLKLSFPAEYKGNLHLYAVDWDSTARRETISVNGSSVALGEFNKGAWISFPVSVATGGTVTITVDRTAGANAVLSGIFLGDSGAPPAMALSSAPEGSWVGTYGSGGYDLLGFSGSSDLTSLTNPAVTAEQANRYTWASSTIDARALQSPDKSTRIAATVYDPNQVRLRLSFTAAYAGNLGLYAVDWDSTARREMISVNGQTAVLSGDFNKGAWVSFPISVAAGGTVTITVDRTAGANAVLSGIFLG